MQKTKSTRTLITLAVLAASMPLAFAADPAPKKESALKKAEEAIKKDAIAAKDTVESQVDKTLGKPLPYQITVDTVDAGKKLFTSKNKDGKVNTFHITDRTQITKGDGVGTVADIKMGETIRGTRYKTGEGDWEAIKVMVGPKTEAAPEAKAKKKAE